ncbi:MAG TPA: helix-turn-helix transcriptional regulator [Streptosporangiaceae bacterium]|nr:helix-turn-helix transcriptional regulator [Streptosporangiaceae bacterium]
MTQQASLVAVHDGFGALRRHHRSASGLTQEELAGRAGLSVRAMPTSSVAGPAPVAPPSVNAASP